MIYLISDNIDLNGFKRITVEKALEILEEIPILSLDTETTELDPHLGKLVLLALGNSQTQVVIDCYTVDIRRFKELITNKPLIIQNAQFDLAFLYKYRIIPKKIHWDTMLAEQVLYNGLSPRANLAFLVDKYYGGKLDKTIREHIANLGVTGETIIYVAKDIEFLEHIANAQITEANKRGVKVAVNLENTFVKVLAYIKFCGFYLDKERWKKKYNNANKDLVAAIKKLDEYVFKNDLTEFIDPQLSLFDTERKTLINWSSSQQLIPLFKKLGISVYDPKTKNQEGVSEQVLIHQAEYFPIIPLYLNFKGISKDFSTYGENFLGYVNKVTDRIHADYNQLMVTGRLSSDNPNMQNLPKDDRTRSCFTAQYEDTILIVGDYSGQEDVVFVNRSQESKMIEFYNIPNADGHSYTAKICFPEELKEIPLEEVKKKRPDLRDIAKRAKFAIHYSGVGKTIARNLNLSLERGEQIYKAYMAGFPGIASYLKTQMNNAKKSGFIRISTITGRKEWCPDYETLVETNDFIGLYKFSKLACNHPIQSESAEITKIAIINMFNWIIDNDLFLIVKIVNTVHDEIILECPISMAKEVSHQLKVAMENAGKIYCKIIPLKADPMITKTWKH